MNCLSFNNTNIPCLLMVKVLCTKRSELVYFSFTIVIHNKSFYVLFPVIYILIQPVIKCVMQAFIYLWSCVVSQACRVRATLSVHHLPGREIHSVISILLSSCIEVFMQPTSNKLAQCTCVLRVRLVVC